ncbi:ABC bile acid transporter [Grosmannia clavigera kw1407]|uniref:ABC bile acid transporter n=1 Tax=Grosmannia clavigera (strain kw1407 / UAMH 11150) TaxID=655863 RepID=F0XT29_GROCL|nr:ABC bile acid transporter [Grosmannia clavigera kw1407]EFW99141.1 ABC bile acid transporter [Grosmannia clavigera kw1407]
MHDDSMIVGVGTALAVIALSTYPAVSGLVLQVFNRQPRDDALYEDADGKATAASVKAFTAKLPKAAIFLSAVLGSAVSLSASILVTLHLAHDGFLVEDWLATAAWNLILLQAIAIVFTRNSTRAYSYGLYTFTSGLLLSFVVLTQDSQVLDEVLNEYPVLFGLRVAEIVAIVGVCMAGILLPRRPDVYFKDEMVDRMYSTSAYGRFTFSWSNDLLGLSTKKQTLDLDDLPRPDHNTRSEDVARVWKENGYSSERLWLSIVQAHAFDFAMQWVLTIIGAFLNFAPQWVILQLLRILETRSSDEARGIDVWIWLVESYVFWLSWAELAIPIRAQLSALIFEKAMRRKDVKSNKKAAKAAVADSSIAANPTEASAEDEGEAGDDELESAKKTKQGTVNLIGLFVSLAFLVQLLGWIPLLAGFSAMAIIMPVNIKFSKKYSDAQDKLMKLRDEKLAVVTEALQGIRQIKFSALEPQWEGKVGEVRDRELKSVWNVFMFDTALMACWITSPIALSAICLLVYAYIHGELTPSVAFVSLGIFRSLETTLSVVPELTTDLLDAWVSIKRIEDYLSSPDIDKVAKDGDVVVFENATIAWPSEEKLEDSEHFILRDLNVTFPAGELSIISGKTGSGKSLLLAAILGEVDLLAGSIQVPHCLPIAERHDEKATKANWILPKSMAFIAQIPWIENATIKENIVFGLPVDEDRYRKTKWRITLARAIYSRAGILIMDDIFSAVDAHVGRHIFEKCLTGELCAGRTRILVTHHVALCAPRTNFLVELGDGRIAHAGLLSELARDGTLDQDSKSHVETAEEAAEDETVDATAVNSDNSTDSGEADGGSALDKVASRATQPQEPERQARKFVEEEKREEGAVRKHVYMAYLNASGGWAFWTGALVFFLLLELNAISRSWWLRIWTGHYQGGDEETVLNLSAMGLSALSQRSVVQQSADLQYSYGLDQPVLAGSGSESGSHSSQYYMTIYVVLAGISALFGSLRCYYVYRGSIRASRTLFAKLNFIILRSPLRWLDTVPVGRILNRFTADFNTIDTQMANSISFGGAAVIRVFGVIIAGLMVSYFVVLLSVLLLLACTYFAFLYIAAVRPVKRLESTAKSPVFEQFGTALSGVATIRGFDKPSVYIERMYRRLDDWSTTTWHMMLFNRWVGWRMSLVGSFFSVMVAAIVLSSPQMDSALAGFALAYAMEFAASIMWAVRLYANVELQMNAAERIIEYTELSTESLEGGSPPAAWPTEGRIEVDNLVVSYAADLPPVLKGVSFDVDRCQRVGVVGRTGAGKSSLTLALFRFLEAQSGSIHVDGIDNSKIKLHDLRSRLAIIPQDPVLFSGTIRTNLDPFDAYTDAELQDCLARVHLTTPVSDSSASAASASSAVHNSNIFDDLQSSVSEGGLNLSQGQRQLLCLARAIVRRPRVMVLDEATSAVDMHTDGLIQRSIREEFTGATLLVIAHRLSTIADFDRILVLQDGTVAEYGSPRDLWAKGSDHGVFRAMCEESGERDRLEKVVLGES